MSVVVISEPVRQRYILIENDAVVRNGFRYRLESNFLGRMLLTIFCCCCWKNDRTVEHWRDHRAFLINNPLSIDHPDYQLWYRAVMRVNRMLPVETIQMNSRPFYQNLPSYRPIARSIPHGSSTLQVNTSQTFHPVNSMPYSSSTLQLNTNPSYQPSQFVAPARVSYPSRVESVNTRPSSVVMPNTSGFQQPHVVQPNVSSFVTPNRSSNVSGSSYTSRPNSVNPGRRRGV